MTLKGDVVAELIMQLPKLLGPVLIRLHGAKGQDAQRQARADWFRLHAMAGSIIAARVLMGGRENTAGHESPMYDAAIATVSATAPDVVRAAAKLGPYWDETDDAQSTKMRAAVTAEMTKPKVKRRAKKKPTNP